MIARVPDDHELSTASKGADPGLERLLGSDELDVVVGSASAGESLDQVGQAVVALAALEEDRLPGAQVGREPGLVGRVGDCDHARAGGQRHLDGHQADAADAVHDNRMSQADRRQPRRMNHRHAATGEHGGGLEADGVGQRYQVLRRSPHQIREASVEREAELPDRVGAERLATRPAGRAAPAPDHVVDGDPIARADRRTGRHLGDDTCALVPEDEALVRRRNHSLEEVELRTAHAGGACLDQSPAVRGRIRDVLDADLPAVDQHCCLHRSSLTSGHCSQR